MSQLKIQIDIEVDTKQFELDYFTSNIEEGCKYKKFDELKDIYLDIIDQDYIKNLKDEHTFKDVKVKIK